MLSFTCHRILQRHGEEGGIKKYIMMLNKKKILGILRVLAHRKYGRPRSCPHIIDHIFGASITRILLFARLFY